LLKPDLGYLYRRTSFPVPNATRSEEYILLQDNERNMDMKICEWNVMKNEPETDHYYFYGPMDEFEPEDYEGLLPVPYEAWSAADFAEIIGDILEDRNHHWMTCVPNLLLKILIEKKLPETEVTMIMKEFAERMEKEIFH